jgi:hypothetical protein
MPQKPRLTQQGSSGYAQQVYGSFAGKPSSVGLSAWPIVLTSQEAPNHPLPMTVRGVQGPNVGSPERRTVVTTQETPWHPAPATFPGTVAAVLRPPTWSIVIKGQEQPDHPLPRLAAGLPTVLSAVRRWIFVPQELPGHPGPTTLAGVYTRPVFVPYVPWIPLQTVQEYPIGHPKPIVIGSFLPFMYPVYTSLTKVTGAYGVTTVR